MEFSESVVLHIGFIFSSGSVNAIQYSGHFFLGADAWIAGCFFSCFFKCSVECENNLNLCLSDT